MVLVQPLIGDSMEFKRIISPTLKELFIEEIETQILSGTLAIGEKLPPEREIAQKPTFPDGVEPPFHVRFPHHPRPSWEISDLSDLQKRSGTFAHRRQGRPLHRIPSHRSGEPSEGTSCYT